MFMCIECHDKGYVCFHARIKKETCSICGENTMCYECTENVKKGKRPKST